MQDLLQGWVGDPGPRGLPSAVVMLQTSGRIMRGRDARTQTGGGSAASRIEAVEAVKAIEKLF